MSILLPPLPTDIGGGAGAGAQDVDLSFFDQDPLHLFPVEQAFALTPEQIDRYYAQDYAATPAIPPAPPTVDKPARPQKGKRRTGLSRREHSLERNRVAASKCRQKKREYTNTLEARCNALAENRTRLEHERSDLQSQVLCLKDELLKHAHCNDGRIGEYLKRMMQQITQDDRRQPSVSVSDSDRHYSPDALSQQSREHRASIATIASTTSDGLEDPDAWSMNREFDEFIKV